ncbi:MAG: biopolymer transporter ExbD [Gammaproteobacteria bacterium]|nr:biopolymer transporter ExbD [Gammaproteobacteria bacterium]
MNLRRQLSNEPEVNLTSLIDVVLLLLVFFMVSTSFVRQAQLKVRLPEASSVV